MAQDFAKTERVDPRLQRATSHTGRHLARKQARRGTGKKQLHLFGIQQSAGEGFPAGHDLDFIQKENRAALVAPFRLQTVVFLDDPMQISRGDPRQALVLEAEVEQSFPTHALRQPIRQDLPQKSGFTGPAHPDNRDRLARYRWKSKVSARKNGYGCSQGIHDFLSD